ncbi:MAG: leucine--tRNA ligase [Candidatus Azotimanducaceae bacterium]|uniref:Leucine--tRNA ligase n=1 Tax=OM182 bacterium TaxID=2510334 RepID=A0A520S307_9GAMM|nr:leucine--tRNA ligase [Gammaproteobacteria bacterium]OUV66985.1 MAG: leucine--tRNA ligase [Gammaproteobacteria bacterium TMED133]RZO76844.1 MAG: leucine--tRNA ligase [OM182 bacterium]
MDDSGFYDFKITEANVQAEWLEHRTFDVAEESSKPKFYCLAMFPYPSGRLHMGHVRTYTLGDVIARFKRLQGYNVMHPMGWDAFGLPAENAAIKNKVPPARWTMQNIEYMKTQLQSLGFSYDWGREFATCDPEYYRWEQWFFTRMFRKGLVYKKSAWVNWDPVDQTVLANEQVIDGRGWRSNALVERRELAQWFLKITDYAEELLAKLNHLPGWPEKIKIMQRNWIGRSKGLQIKFARLEGSAIDVYTTRPDTLMGVTYLAVAPQHPIAKEAAETNSVIAEFLTACNQVKMAEADIAKSEKKGMDTGIIVQHPITKEPLPVWVANFVLMEYGSGAVMSVPAHDQRDWEFARQYNLPVKQVIEPDKAGECDLDRSAFVEKGRCINSGQFDSLNFEEVFDAIADLLQSNGLGERQVNYRLRDWGVSRQRYWGCPIPIIHCDACGAVAVPDSDLPVSLPTEVEFDGVTSPIKRMPEWSKTICPSCGGPAERDTDTFDTFMESSWYYARFACNNLRNGMLDDRAKYWKSVDHYVGGEEHAILHLLYARFFHKVMRDQGLVDTDEPFENLLALGMVLQDGAKMSKSAGNAGDPQHLLDQYGADAVRMAMMFAAPPEQSFEWSEHNVESANRWLRSKLWRAVILHSSLGPVSTLDSSSLSESQRDMRRVAHETLLKVTDDYGKRLNFNTVVSGVMSLVNELQKFNDTSDQGRAVVDEALKIVVLVMSPITPHICKELWTKLGLGVIEDAEWLSIDQEALRKRVVNVIIQVNGRLRGKLEVEPGASKDDLILRAGELENVEKFLKDEKITRIIHVPDKLLNFVIA